MSEHYDINIEQRNKYSLLLPSATKLRRLCFYRRLSVHSGVGVSASVHAGIPHPSHPCSRHPPRSKHHPGADTPRSRPPPGADTPRGKHPPVADIPSGSRHHPPPYWSRHPLGADPPGADTPPRDTATAADGTHPTGMHSCDYWIVSQLSGCSCTKFHTNRSIEDVHLC